MTARGDECSPLGHGHGDLNRFLEDLYRGADGFATVSGQRLGAGDFGKRETFSTEQLDQAAARIVAESRIGDVWVNAVVQHREPPTRGGSRDAGRLVSLWADLDAVWGVHKGATGLFESVDEMRQMLATFPHRPSYIIDSAGGWQCWWLLDEPVDITEQNRNDIDRLVKDWGRHWEAQADAMGRKADPVWDLARVLRPPGSANWKSGEALPVVVVERSDERNDLDDLMAVVDRTPTPTPKASQTTTARHDISGARRPSPGDRFNAERATRADVVAWLQEEPYGYHTPTKRTATLGDGERAGTDLLRRSKQSGSKSITVFDPAPDADWPSIWAFSTSETPDKIRTGESYTPFGFHAAWNHDGDHSAAARALRRLPTTTRLTSPQLAAISTMAANYAPSTTRAPDGLRYTDVDNGKRLVRLWGDQLRYVPTWERWLVWDGTVWRRDSKRDVFTEGLAKDVSAHLFEQLRQFPLPLPGATAEEAAQYENARKPLFKWATQTANQGKLRGLVAMARSENGIIVNHNDLDADPWLLCVRNGYVNLHDGTFHQPDPDKLMTMQAPVEYDPEATAPTWERSLEEWLPDDDLRDYFHRLSGEAVVGAIRDHLLVVLYGGGANGKGTAVGALRHTLGPYFVTPHKGLLVVERHSEHATVYADLFRVRLAVAVETERRQKLSEASVKNLSGGDEIKARRMQEDYWSFEPTHTLWLQTNYLPEIAGQDEGIWRRLKVMPWLARFDGAKRDGALGEKLQQETPGILNWLIQGALAWRRDGLTEPEAVVKATLDYRRTEDVLARFADDVGLVFGDEAKGHHTAARDITSSLVDWARSEGVERPDGKTVGAWLGANGCRSVRSRKTPTDPHRQVRAWVGVTFKTRSSDPQQSPPPPDETPETPLPGPHGTREEFHRDPDELSHPSLEELGSSRDNVATDMERHRDETTASADTITTDESLTTRKPVANAIHAEPGRDDGWEAP